MARLPPVRPGQVARVKYAAKQKLTDVEEGIAELERVRNGSATLIAARPGHGREADCLILNALGRDASS